MLGLAVANSLVIFVHSYLRTAIFGVLVIIVANALLGTRRTLALTVLIWIANFLAVWFTARSNVGQDARQAFDVLLLYSLTLGAAWLANRPLTTSVGWAMSGWVRARDALLELRERRAELYRVVRALEEATYRLEHVNNELVVARREAETARALKARLAATVSHELRGPLNLILGFSKLMVLSPESYGEPLPRVYHADMDAIYRNSQHLVSLVDDILDLSQIEAQRLPLVKDRIDLGEDVVKKALNIIQPLAERKGLSIRQELEEGLPYIVADPVRLRQALLNLLTNAVRFTERGGITVRASRRDDHLLVSVQDTGPGIAPEDIPKLFREFSQAHLSNKHEAGGSGLGLSISKHLVDLHGGQIWVESRIGKGTTFHFTIPLPGTQPIPANIVRSDGVSQKKKLYTTCLVVHDDPGIVRLLARYIEGYQLIAVPDPKDIGALVERLYPKAVLANSLSAEQTLHELSRTPFDVPVITTSLPSVTTQGRLNGILGYLVKPIASEALVALMGQVERNGETTVLVVDDDPDAVRLIERMLTPLPRPYNILEAYDGQRALEIMKTTVPDVVVLDLIMSGVDGYAVIAQMRADERLCGVPIVVVSAQDWIDDGLMLDTPICVHFREPIGIAKGVKCLQALLDALSPSYLADGEGSEEFSEGYRDQSASGEPPPHLKLRPALAGPEQSK